MTDASDAPAAPAMSATDPRHTLTSEERAWCANLRRELAAHGVPEPQPRSDFLLAQFALVAKGKTHKAIKRVRRYNEIITAEHDYAGCEAASSAECVGFLNRVFPGLVHLPPPQTADAIPTVVLVAAEFLPHKLDANPAEGGVRRMLTEFMVLLDALTADLEDVRKGVCFVQQCRGMGWANYSHKIESEAAQVYQDSYPTRFHSLPCVEPGPFFRVMIKLVKLFLSRKLRQRIAVVGRESELYTDHGFDKATMPACAGGSAPEADPDEAARLFAEAVRARLDRRAESVAKVKI